MQRSDLLEEIVTMLREREEVPPHACPPYKIPDTQKRLLVSHIINSLIGKGLLRQQGSQILPGYECEESRDKDDPSARW